MLTTQDADQYIRLTLKQWKVNPSVKWNELSCEQQGALGLYWPSLREIDLHPKILKSFETFRIVFLHELAHYMDYMERGEKVGKDFHGVNFKKWCHKLGITGKTRPVCA